MGESQALWMKPRSRLVSHGSPELPFLMPATRCRSTSYSFLQHQQENSPTTKEQSASLALLHHSTRLESLYLLAKHYKSEFIFSCHVSSQQEHMDGHILILQPQHLQWMVMQQVATTYFKGQPGQYYEPAASFHFLKLWKRDTTS